MLKELRLKNIILVESATICFERGFNVLSGESGSGKSAIMNALSLIAGERFDASLIRRGAEKGIVEAVFDVNNTSLLDAFLFEAGIDHESGSELFIRRELSTNGKSRAFINNQLAQLTLLKQLNPYLFDMVGQHANQRLFSLDFHRHTLDLYADLQNQLSSFGILWEEENTVRHSLEQLVQSESRRLREIETFRFEINELHDANLQEGEDEELFLEYSQLSIANELTEKIEEFNGILSDHKFAILPQLNRAKNSLEELIKLLPSLSEALPLYSNALIELQEVSHLLSKYASHTEYNPNRMEELNERLKLIDKLKRKYGPTIGEMQGYLREIQQKLIQLEKADEVIEELREKLAILSEKSNKLSLELTERRKQAAKKFENAVCEHLQSLNMPKSEFHISISPQKRSQYGDDRIEFFLKPNIGEHCIPLKECASGGELSRTLLSLQVVIADKGKTPCLIFDEIDGNIGGETASIVGKKLSELASHHQVICVTHFPQVAKYADYHLSIFKEEIDGRTITAVRSLDENSRNLEIARMLGGHL